jgi:hypothetical protein
MEAFVDTRHCALEERTTMHMKQHNTALCNESNNTAAMCVQD